MERVCEAGTLWCTTVEQVNKTVEKSTTSEAAHTKAAIGALENLLWDGKIHGFKAGGSVDNLTLWFTDWLKTDHENQMLELLVLDLGITDGSTSCIEPMHFVHILAQAYSDPDNCHTAHHFGWLQWLGTSFAMKDRTCLGTIANKDENHWVALSIDCEKQVIGYGFRGKPLLSLCKHLNWWLFKHLGVVFQWTGIPVAKQNDSHSCGILGYFDLVHWFNSVCFALPKCTSASMANKRIKMFLQIVECHNKKVCY
jgi:hypothetical protein